MEKERALASAVLASTNLSTGQAGDPGPAPRGSAAGPGKAVRSLPPDVLGRAPEVCELSPQERSGALAHAHAVRPGHYGGRRRGVLRVLFRRRIQLRLPHGESAQPTWITQIGRASCRGRV